MLFGGPAMCSDNRRVSCNTRNSRSHGTIAGTGDASPSPPRFSISGRGTVLDADHTLRSQGNDQRLAVPWPVSSVRSNSPRSPSELLSAKSLPCLNEFEHDRRLTRAIGMLL